MLRIRLIKKISAVWTIFFFSYSVYAQTPSPDSKPETRQAAKPEQKEPSKKDTSSKSVVKTDSLSILWTDKTKAYHIDDFITITIKEPIDTVLKLYGRDKIMLWLDGIPFPNLTVWRANSCKHKLTFCLIRDTVVNSSWDHFYKYGERGCFLKYSRLVQVQIGTIDKCITPVSKPIVIYTSECWMLWIGYLFIIGLICFLYWLVFKKHILQDGLPFADNVQLVDQYSTESANEVLRSALPYSLARTQLMFWLFLVSAGILFIWLNTDTLVEVTTSVATLIGISGGTSILSKIIESRPLTEPKITADQFKSGQYSEGFPTDILSDNKSISIARVQMFVFTIIIGLYFCWYVIYYMQMPNFSSGLLLLLGVSSSTYAGVKFSEK
jgi:hypothetical protein